MNPAISFRIKAAYRKRGRHELMSRSVAAALTAGNPDVLAQNKPLCMSIVLTHDQELRDLNRAYRGIDKPTDVLSFEGGDVYRTAAAQDNPHNLGDIIVSMDQCSINAQRAGHDEDDELALLIVHGTLHLVGFDHMNKVDKARMWSVQKWALIALPLSSSFKFPR